MAYEFGDITGWLTSGNMAKGWDRFINGRTNEVNEAIAKENLEYQREALEKNLGFQYENLDYQKALQQEIFNREDTSYQRTAADMRAAGLNPLTMNGTNGAGEAIQTEAPQVEALHNDFQYQGAGMGQIMQAMGQIINQFQDFKIGNQVSKSNELDIERKGIENKYAEMNAEADYLAKLEDLSQKGAISQDMWRELRNREEKGLFTTEPKYATEAKGIISNIPEALDSTVHTLAETKRKAENIMKTATDEKINQIKNAMQEEKEAWKKDWKTGFKTSWKNFKKIFWGM